MDPSALIFVALAVAWGAYLIPKALEHHDSGARSRSISTFSERVRVLARREAVTRRRSALVASASAKPAPVVPSTVPHAGASTPPSTPAANPATGAPTARPAASPLATPVEVVVEEIMVESLMETTQSGRLHLPTGLTRPAGSSLSPAGVAARRRRRVLGVLVFLFAATAAMAAGQVVTWLALIAPALLIAGWLVLCRVMVTQERVQRPAGRVAAPSPVAADVAPQTVVAELQADDTATIPAVPVLGTGSGETWEPVNAPLPTYVSKDAAPRRSVTIDLDSTGVWTSGRSEVDSAIAREADAARAQSVKAENVAIKRASGA